MTQTTMGPKGGHRPNTAIAGTAIVRGTAVKRGADLNTLVQATAASVNQGIATDNQDTVGRTFPFVDQPGEIVEARVGAAVALDALLTTDASGRLITAATTNPVIAHALQAATAADQLVPVRLAQRGIVAP
jgi:hypothetical protein